MRFLTICSNCKVRSSSLERYCPDCGEEKGEDIGKRSFLSSIYDDINQKYDLSPDTWILFQLIFRIVLFVAGVFLIPAFIQESELFLIVLYIYAIFGIIKEIERRVPQVKGIYLFAKILVAAYIGAGSGNIIHYTGMNHNITTLSYFFNLDFLWSEVSSGNVLIIIGILGGVFFMSFGLYFYNLLR